jgi:hypothetical protein
VGNFSKQIWGDSPERRHLSSSEVELTSLLRRLAGFNCRVFTTHASKAAVAVGLAQHRGEW